MNLLVSDGDIPALAAALAAETFWTGAVNGGTVDTLSNHLIENTPAEAAGGRYRNPIRHHGRHAGRQQHRLRPLFVERLQRAVCLARRLSARAVDPDPWGNRYAVNVAFLDPSATAAVAGITAGFAAERLPAPRCLRAVGRA